MDPITRLRLRAGTPRHMTGGHIVGNNYPHGTPSTPKLSTVSTAIVRAFAQKGGRA